ncbi:MAG: hypothetical protein R3330_14285 [Saprospiraceae bacterium]|nr:hypothetical protein [Saprospiraceae bacterium]
MRWIKTWVKMAYYQFLVKLTASSVIPAVRDETRRRLVSRLRNSPTRLWLLDNATVEECTIMGNLQILGDHSVVHHSVFVTDGERRMAVRRYRVTI